MDIFEGYIYNFSGRDKGVYCKFIYLYVFYIW